MHPFVENTLVWLIEAGLAAWPRPEPDAAQLERAMIVAHRGERDGVHVRENTFAAFDPVVAAGVGAIEFDIRYTRDDEPVVLHDSTLKRVFGRRTRIDALTWRALKAELPEIPHLAEMIERYSGRSHLMIELKTRGSERAETRLRDWLSRLEPGAMFHVLSLDPTLFAALADLPSRAFIPVAKSNWRPIRDWARHHECGGAAGFFAQIRSADIAHARAHDRFIGSGFIRRRGVMLREIGRDVPWIFTNQPLALQRLLERQRSQHRQA